jgi:hypothetical protein
MGVAYDTSPQEIVPNHAHVRAKADTIDTFDGQPQLILRNLQKRRELSDNPAYRLAR